MKPFLLLICFLCCAVSAADSDIHYGEKVFNQTHQDIPSPAKAGLVLWDADQKRLTEFYLENYTPALAGGAVDPDGVPVYPGGAPRDKRAADGEKGTPIPYRLVSIRK